MKSFGEVTSQERNQRDIQAKRGMGKVVGQ